MRCTPRCSSSTAPQNYSPPLPAVPAPDAGRTDGRVARASTKRKWIQVRTEVTYQLIKQTWQHPRIEPTDEPGTSGNRVANAGRAREATKTSEVAGAAQRAYALTRSHFKGQDKSSDKRRIAFPPDDPRIKQNSLRQIRAGLKSGLPAMEQIANGIGDARTMAFKAMLEARLEGAPAALWGFEQPDALPSHVVCLVGEPELYEIGMFIGKATPCIRNFDNDGNVWVVDPWGGICCPLPEYHTKFLEKMGKWATQGKEIRRTYITSWRSVTNPELATREVTIPRRHDVWGSPTDPTWLMDTIYRPLFRFDHGHPDPVRPAPAGGMAARAPQRL